MAPIAAPALSQLVVDFAAALKLVDSRAPIAPAPKGRDYFAGIGPHTEAATIRLVMDELGALHPDRYASVSHEVAYGDGSGRSCDLVWSTDSESWAVEVKMLRLLGNNGKPNDSMVSHIMSPYAHDNSAVSDSVKLQEAACGERKAILIYAYDYDAWPMLQVIDAFELLAGARTPLGGRLTAHFHDLVHPVHQPGAVFAWQLLP